MHTAVQFGVRKINYKAVTIIWARDSKDHFGNYGKGRIVSENLNTVGEVRELILFECVYLSKI